MTFPDHDATPRPLPVPDEDPAWLFGLAPLVAMAAIVPYVVRFIYVEIPAELAGGYFNWRMPDAYTHYKGLLVLAVGAVAGLSLILKACSPALRQGGGQAAINEPSPLNTAAPQSRAPSATLAQRLRRAPRALAAWLAGRDKERWPILALGLSVLASTLLSPYAFTAWIGAPLRREGALTLLAYLAIALHAREWLRDPRAFRWFFRLLVWSVWPIALWGIVQAAWGHNILNDDFVRGLTVSAPSANSGRGISATIDGVPAEIALALERRPPVYGKTSTSASLYNPNYFGTFMAVALAASLGWLLASWDRRRLFPWLAQLVAAAGLAGGALMYSFCLGGYFGLGLAAAATAALLLWPRRRPPAGGESAPDAPAGAEVGVGVGVGAAPSRRRFGVMLYIVWALVLAGAFALSLKFTPPGKKLLSHLDSTLELMFKKYDPADGSGEPFTIVRGMKLRDNVLRFDTSVGELVVTARLPEGEKAPELVVRDANGQRIPLRWRSIGGGRRQTLLPFHLSRIDTGEAPGTFRMYFRQPEEYWADFWFRVDSGQTLRFRPSAWREMKEASLPVPSWEPWKGFTRFGSRRGYFWSRALPLVADRPLFGHGPDTVAHFFPHHDLMGRQPVWMGTYSVHKVHSWLLGTALGTGLVGVALLLIFLATHFVRLGRCLRDMASDAARRESAEGRVLFGAAMSAWAGGITYVGAVCWTDSTLHFSPLFWTLAGVGWAAAASWRRGNSELRKGAGSER